MAEESVFSIVPKSKLDWIESVLQQVQQVMNNNTRTSKLEDEWVSSEEARKVLGVSPKTWQSYRDKRLLEL